MGDPRAGPAGTLPTRPSTWTGPPAGWPLQGHCDLCDCYMLLWGVGGVTWGGSNEVSPSWGRGCCLYKLPGEAEQRPPNPRALGTLERDLIWKPLPVYSVTMRSSWPRADLVSTAQPAAGWCPRGPQLLLWASAGHEVGVRPARAWPGVPVTRTVPSRKSESGPFPKTLPSPAGEVLLLFRGGSQWTRPRPPARPGCESPGPGRRASKPRGRPHWPVQVHSLNGLTDRYPAWSTAGVSLPKPIFPGRWPP